MKLSALIKDHTIAVISFQGITTMVVTVRWDEMNEASNSTFAPSYVYYVTCGVPYADDIDSCKKTVFSGL